MDSEKEKADESKSLVVKSLSGVALLSLFFWPGRKKAGAQPVEVRKPTKAVPRAANQTGRMEKA